MNYAVMICALVRTWKLSLLGDVDGQWDGAVVLKKPLRMGHAGQATQACCYAARAQWPRPARRASPAQSSVRWPVTRTIGARPTRLWGHARCGAEWRATRYPESGCDNAIRAVPRFARFDGRTGAAECGWRAAIARLQTPGLMRALA